MIVLCRITCSLIILSYEELATYKVYGVRRFVCNFLRMTKTSSVDLRCLKGDCVLGFRRVGPRACTKNVAFYVGRFKGITGQQI